MGRRQRSRRRAGPAEEGASEYARADGSVLRLRDRLSKGTLEQVRGLGERASAASSVDDLFQRRHELLFERLAVAWTIADLPLTGQAELLGRYRMADPDTRRWVRETVASHARRNHPELDL